MPPIGWGVSTLGPQLVFLFRVSLVDSLLSACISNSLPSLKLLPALQEKI